MLLNALLYSIQLIQRLNDINISKKYVIFPYFISLIYFKDISVFFLISGIIGAIFTLYIFFAPGKNFTACMNFWKNMNNEGGYATEYFRNSPFWKIEGSKTGFIKDWFGPYLFRSYDHTFFIYCKTDDVSKYWDDFLQYKYKH
jgi:hypothetical protein